jgi:hypothetical protein
VAPTFKPPPERSEEAAGVGLKPGVTAAEHWEQEEEKFFLMARPFDKLRA